MSQRGLSAGGTSFRSHRERTPSIGDRTADRFFELANAPFEQNVASEDTAQALLRELYFQRAVQSYLWALPAMNILAMKEGCEKAFGRGYNVMPVWRRRLDPKTLVTTPNSDVIYAMGFVDLEEDGPLVVEVAPGLQGIFDDFFQRPLTGPLTEDPLGLPTLEGRRWFGDVGLVGPDKGQGGKYILLPPDYEGEEPEDGFVFRSRTYGVFIFWRAFFEDPTDLTRPVRAMEETKIYPLGMNSSAKPMMFPEGSGVVADLLFPRDASYFDMLARFIDDEFVDPVDMDMRGMLASIGIVKGQPFDPDELHREILNQAAMTAFKISKAMFTHGIRDWPGGLLWPDRQYVNAFIGGSPFFHGDTFTNLDNRAVFFSWAYSASPAMAMSIPGMGAKYPATVRDADGEILVGDRTYKLHLPKNIPVRLFWSVTAYDAEHASGLDNGQPLPSINSMDEPVQNDDGSVDIYFGPRKPAEGDNWLATVPGKAWFILLRLYGPERAYFDDTWKPDDIVKIDL